MWLTKVQTFCRKMEQLVLLVKALRALKLSLLFAQGEIRVGHLKSSNAVKNGETDRCSEALPFSTGACNKPQRSIKFFYYLCLQFSVLNDLNSRYHQCLEKASNLKQLLEPGLQTLDGKSMTVSLQYVCVKSFRGWWMLFCFGETSLQRAGL